MENDVKYPVNAGFFNSINKDREYSADDMNMPYRKLISNGVFATPKGERSDELQVFAANDGMNVIVSSGNAIIGDKWFENPSDKIITISQNSEIVERIDSIIAQIDKTQPGRAGSIVYRKGNASSNPVHPSINVEDGIFEMRLADITVSPSCVKITQGLIKDCRGSNECPWITSLIKQVDTSTLYTQWQAAYQEYYEDQKNGFMIWFNEVKDQLSEDAAGNLYNMLETIEGKIEAETEARNAAIEAEKQLNKVATEELQKKIDAETTARNSAIEFEKQANKVARATLKQELMPVRITNDNGVAIKYPDGTMICTRKITKTMTDIKAWGSLFYGADNTEYSFAEAFIDIPTVNLTLLPTASESCWLGSYSKPAITKTSFKNYAAIRPTTATSIAVELDVLAIGRWK